MARAQLEREDFTASALLVGQLRQREPAIEQQMIELDADGYRLPQIVSD